MDVLTERQAHAGVGGRVRFGTMHPNAVLLTQFYTALGNRDADAMAACYDTAVQFSDEVFPDLEGDEARAMWQMFCERGKDLRIEFGNVDADDNQGRADWEAWYTFTATGRPVHNRIVARFDFRAGKIFRHHDSFSFWRWARQALGPVGWLLGWTPVVKNKVRRQAAANLRKYVEKSV
jgi:ketosteroid isomerase-like protein